MTGDVSPHADEMVMVVNTISRKIQPISRDEVDTFLRKHKLFRLVEEESPAETKKKPKKSQKKVIKQEKEEVSTQSKYVSCSWPVKCL